MGFINYFFNNFNKALVYLALIAWVLLIVYITLRIGYIMGLAASFFPLSLLLFVLLSQNPYWSFIVLFVSNYLVMGVSRYIGNMSPGILMDFVIVIIILSLILNNFKRESHVKFSNALNTLTLLAFIWFLYCILEIFNPHSSSIIAWFASSRALGVYFIIIVSITAIVMRKYNDFKRLLFIWAILSLLAVIKAFVQKTFGFDGAELRWLYEEGGRSTHVLYYGIRYFSIFTDAANFGTGIAFSGVVFAISSLYFKEIHLKIFYLLISLACAYGMMISGTRGSIAVPFVALTVFVFLSKNIKYIILTIIALILAFVFLNYTTYGNGISYIRRMRSAFNQDDASYKLRIENQKKLRTYMWDKPFGVGIGMSYDRGASYRPNPFVSKIPTDGWYVRVWVETGIVGLSLHILILLYIVTHGAFLVLFRLKNLQLKGLITALICGISGVYVAAYSIEIIGQFPSSFILFTCMTFIFLSPNYDKELMKKELKNHEIYETIA